MRILEKHLTQTVTMGALMTLLVLSALASFFAVIDELSDIGGNYGIAQVLSYVAFTVPRTAYEVFPTAVLIGGLLSLGTLANHSELVVMRSAGLSVSRIGWSVIKAGFILMLIAIFLGEGVAPPAEQFAANRRAIAQKKPFSLSGRGFWARDGNSYIGIKKILPDSHLEGVTVYTFGGQHQLSSILTAKSGLYKDNHWILYGVRETSIHEKRMDIHEYASKHWDSLLSPDVLEAISVQAENLSIVALYNYVKHLKQNKQDAAKYELAFWVKLVKPFSSVIMLLVALPFVFGSQRSTTVGQRLLIGVLVGLGFHLMNQALNHIGVGYGLNPIVSAFLPTLLFGGAGIWALKRVF